MNIKRLFVLLTVFTLMALTIPAHAQLSDDEEELLAELQALIADQPELTSFTSEYTEAYSEAFVIDAVRFSDYAYGYTLTMDRSANLEDAQFGEAMIVIEEMLESTTDYSYTLEGEIRYVDNTAYVSADTTEEEGTVPNVISRFDGGWLVIDADTNPRLAEAISIDAFLSDFDEAETDDLIETLENIVERAQSLTSEDVELNGESFTTYTISFNGESMVEYLQEVDESMDEIENIVAEELIAYLEGFEEPLMTYTLTVDEAGVIIGVRVEGAVSAEIDGSNINANGTFTAEIEFAYSEFITSYNEEIDPVQAP